MKGSLKASAACAASALTFALLLFGWAASPSRGAAHFLSVESTDEAFRLDLSGLIASSRPLDSAELNSSGKARPAAVTQSTRLPSPVGFREDGGRGLLVRAWVNGAGPYTFAVDTGAGATIISPRVAGEARVEARRLSRAASRSARATTPCPRAAWQSSRPACPLILTAYSTRPKPSRHSAM